MPAHFFACSRRTFARKVYEMQRQVGLDFLTKLGVPLGQLDYARLETHHFQKIMDSIVDEGTPTKANSLMR